MLHTHLPTPQDIETLAAVRATPALSIYLRTTPLTQDAQSDRIELKNLLKSALQEMHAANIDKRAIAPIEANITDLVEDDDFWATQANSLAIFATPEKILTYQLGNHVTNLVEVSDRFHLKPLLRAVTFPHNAWVLALSMGAVRLIEITADSAPRHISIPALPKSMADSLGRRSHGEITGGLAKAGDRSESALLTRYCRAIDKALHPVLAGHRRPLILAAAEPLASTFRAVCTYHAISSEVIAGSPDHTPDHDLAAAARGVLDGIYAAEISGFKSLFAERAQQHRATTDIAQAARAATYGAIDTIMVDMDGVLSGTIDPDGNVTFAETPDATNYGVVDEIARRALTSGARVLAARRQDIPENSDLAAILRYAF